MSILPGILPAVSWFCRERRLRVISAKRALLHLCPADLDAIAALLERLRRQCGRAA